MVNQTLEIYFYDLSEDARKKVLELYNMKDESDGNFEISPLAILEYNPSEE